MDKAVALSAARGNPLNIRSLQDLTRPGLRFVHRPRGTGTRVVLEELLAAQHLKPEQISGFDRTEPSHQAAAVVVASGNADAAFGENIARQVRVATDRTLIQLGGSTTPGQDASDSTYSLQTST